MHRTKTSKEKQTRWKQERAVVAAAVNSVRLFPPTRAFHPPTITGGSGVEQQGKKWNCFKKRSDKGSDDDTVIIEDTLV